MHDRRLRRRLCLKRAGLAALAGSLGAWAPAAMAQAEPTALEKIRKRGRLSVAVYQELPPFHVNGKGIEVELAGALAKALGVELSLLPFAADEDMHDDLRHMVWRGHYLGFGPADVMLHVPVDRPLMQATPQAEIFAPYWRERVMIARDLQKVPTMPSLAAFAGQKIAVPGQSLAGWLLIGTDNGAYREQLITTAKSGVEAAGALQRGEVAAAAGNASELESALGRDPRFAIEPLPVPRMREGWAVGMAVKASATDLARALQTAINELGSSGELSAMFARGGLNWRKV